jgi:hypothetical protein
MDEQQTSAERRGRVSRVRPGGYLKRDELQPSVRCNVERGVHRWARPFGDGDTCSCGTFHLVVVPRGAVAFEVHDV